MSPVVDSLPEFYAHALAIEREAVARYQELADQMHEHNNFAARDLFAWLADNERQHAQELVSRAEGIALPQLDPWEYKWVDPEAPESAPHEEAHYLMTPHHALQLALRNERRAAEYYDRVARTAKTEAIRKLAEEYAAEERRHIEHVEQALARQEDPTAGWDEDLDDPQAVE